MTKLIVFDGPDNCGKTTAINALIAQPQYERSYVIKQHHSKPAEGENPFLRYSMLLEDQLSLAPDLIVWDRGPLSAYVYESYYRGSSQTWEATLELVEGLAQMCELEYRLLYRPWVKVLPAHLREIACGVHDPNQASLENREDIHYAWLRVALSSQDSPLVSVIDQEW